MTDTNVSPLTPIPDFLIWHCAGCGKAAVGKQKPCDCPTNVGTRKGPNGKPEQTWWDDAFATPLTDIELTAAYFTVKCGYAAHPGKHNTALMAALEELRQRRAATKGVAGAFVLVPREPTEAMCAAGKAEIGACHDDHNDGAPDIENETEATSAYRAMIAAAPPAVEIDGDVAGLVAEWHSKRSSEFGRATGYREWLKETGDRLAAALTKATQECERLKSYDPENKQDYDLAKLWDMTDEPRKWEVVRGSDAMGHSRNIESQNFLARKDGGLMAVCSSPEVAEKIITWIKAYAEVQRFLIAFGRASRALSDIRAERDTLKAEVERLTAALEEISESRDAGRHDGLPEPYPAHEGYAMWAIARAALDAALAPALGADKGEQK